MAGGERGVSARDFRPAVGGLKREGSWHATAARNVDLIELARTIEAAGRPATLEEQEQLSKYVGFGAGEIRNQLFPVPSSYAKSQDPERLIWPDLTRDNWKPLAERLAALPLDWQRSLLQSTQYAHYTSEGVIRSVWSGMQRLGFTGGKILEPGMGIGNFAMLMPSNVRSTSKYTGVEFDAPTALIARLLSPQQQMLHDDFIKRKLPRDYFDAAIGNPPFAKTKVLADPDYEKLNFSLHDFFFAKTLDRVRPGGLVAFVTSHYTMDKAKDQARRYMAERADLLGAVRLPQTAFEANAGTKVTTDVLFLRKRKPGEERGGVPWQDAATITTPDGPAVVNEYFAAHPEMILGEQRLSGNRDSEGRRIDGLRGQGEYTVVSYDKTPEDLDAKFAKAIEQLPQNVYSSLSADEAQLRRETAKVDFDPSVKREGVIYLGKKGEIMRVTSGVGRELTGDVKLSPKDLAWFKGYVGLRDLVNASRLAQVQDGDWQTAQKALNKAYDRFVKANGPINAFRTYTNTSLDDDGNEVETVSRRYVNRRLLREDYDSAVVAALERIDDEGQIVKGPFLLDRTISKPAVPEIKTPGDALAVSLDALGQLDLDDVAKRVSLPRDEVIEALGPSIYQTPQGKWQLADEYLSGNVRVKLDEAEHAVGDNPALRRNIEALKAVQPERLGPSQISVKLGASWVKPEYVSAFADEIGAGHVTFDAKTESWQVAGAERRSGRRAGEEYGTARRSPSELLEVALNSRTVTIKDKIDGKEVTDKEGTDAANAMVAKIKDKFRSWIWTDSERATDLVGEYNDRFNNIAPRSFNGSHLTLPGVSTSFKPHAHQLRAIWRQIQAGNTYLAHAVGAGKTFEMIAGGMEQKRLGLIKKPIYVVPNHMLEQFSNEFMDFYPLANVMVADDENFSKERRKAFVVAATLNAPDAIVITHSAFERIGVKEKTVAPIRDEILLDLQTALADVGSDERVRRSQLQQQIEAVEQRFDRIVGSGSKDSTIKFEDMGVDFAYVDEAHAFRKLDFTTNQKIKGIDPTGSKRSLDMYVKTRFLEKARPGRSMVFATGTPVTNTMGELYTIQRFFQPEEMDRTGTATFDGWARQYGEAVPALEANAAGRYETVTRFAKFENVPELMARIRSFMDVLTSEHLGALVKRPSVKGGKPNMILVEQTPDLKRYMTDVLMQRLEISRAWKPSKDQPSNPDPVVAIITDGRFAALDPRFFGAHIDENTTPTKLTAMADRTAAEYHATENNDYGTGRKGGTQIVFYNFGFGASAATNRGFDGRAAFTRRLIKQGVKRADILWFDDANTDAKKEEMFKAMRSGEARILIGSAKKMGTGVNVQTRLTELQYFDPPWYPADMEQPIGRIIRQKNLNEEAGINWFATKGTYDSTMYQMVARKQRFIDQAFSGDRSVRTMEDLSEASAYEQAAALASGDPRALQLAGYRQDVERYERLQAAHSSEQVNVRSALMWAQSNKTSQEKLLARLQAAFDLVPDGYMQFTEGRVRGKSFDKLGDWGTALKAAFNVGVREMTLDPTQAKRVLGTIGPITVSMETMFDRKDTPTGEAYLHAQVGEVRDLILTGSGIGDEQDVVGLGRKFINFANGIDRQIKGAKNTIQSETDDITRLRKKLGAPFEYMQELGEKYAALKTLEAELSAEGAADAAAAAAARAGGTPKPAVDLAQGWESADTDTPGGVDERPRASVAEVKREALALFGPDFAKRVTVVPSTEALPPSLRGPASAANAIGLTHNSEHVYLIADQMPQGDVRGMLMHELGVHIGMSSADIARLTAQVERWAKGSDRLAEMARWAMAHAKESRSTAKEEETLAYMVQALTDAGTPLEAAGLVGRFLRIVRNALHAAARALGINVEMSPADVLAYAYGSAKLALRTEQGVAVEKSPGTGPSYSAASFLRRLDPKRELMASKTTRVHTPEQLQAMRNVGFITENVTMEERAKALWKDAGKKLAQGLVDQFAPIKDISKVAYGLARLSKGASGAFETLLQGGMLKLTQGVYDFDAGRKGGFAKRFLVPLQGEHQDVLRWIAANRAEQLTKEERENLFSEDDIAAFKTLADKTTAFDYTIQHGANKGLVTRDRTLIYPDATRMFNEFGRNVLDMAEQSGLIDGDKRAIWERDFYVPFYRVVGEAGDITGPDVKKGLVRQEAFKTLKGGTSKLNADLLDNALRNWSHLLDASAKNRAAKAAIEAAEQPGIAMATPLKAPGGEGTVFFREKGEKRYSMIHDEYFMTAVSSLGYAGMRSPVMNAMSFFKHALTEGVTRSPFFKVRNLVRDSVQSIATDPGLGLNPVANVAEGFRLTPRDADSHFQLLASGGTIHFGTLYEGNEAKRMQRLVDAGIDSTTVLDGDNKLKAFVRTVVRPAIDAYDELGNRGEEINRATLYAQLVRQGVGHAEAALRARDLMDFSMQGSFTSIRFLTQVVPFFNARIQGLYKLGRAGKEDPARLALVLGAAAALSIGLLAAYSDDDDWKKREEWDRNNYWWLKFGGVAYRIPKPFEIGAIATLAERTFELAFEKEMTGQRFRSQVLALAGDNLSMNPIPQMVKPILDVYANYDSFTGRPIETAGMERLAPDYRFNEQTSMTARAASTAANAVTDLVGVPGVHAPSPVQIDHMLRGYFGWMGSFVVGAGDMIARLASDKPAAPSPDYWKVATGGMVADLEGAPSRYLSQLYSQAKAIEQAYGTWHELRQQGKFEEADNFEQAHRDEIAKYRTVERAKRVESTLGERARRIRESNASGDEKRQQLRDVQQRRDAEARTVQP